ncbi:hypothetical protein BLNAU_15576 [Blattamonas nauphoetae]|uniref:Uncharacterized protein n=1 Tax=Blattamonas nauphoetae TaxID=2049346 RepID=A0ABQ9XDX1_9EUKA|nr:hypothetical protein BLNAU_15576 [Blattamonas nauphoetae]
MNSGGIHSQLRAAREETEAMDLKNGDEEDTIPSESGDLTIGRSMSDFTAVSSQTDFDSDSDVPTTPKNKTFNLDEVHSFTPDEQKDFLSSEPKNTAVTELSNSMRQVDKHNDHKNSPSSRNQHTPQKNKHIKNIHSSAGKGRRSRSGSSVDANDSSDFALIPPSSLGSGEEAEKLNNLDGLLHRLETGKNELIPKENLSMSNIDIMSEYRKLQERFIAQTTEIETQNSERIQQLEDENKSLSTQLAETKTELQQTQMKMQDQMKETERRLAEPTLKPEVDSLEMEKNSLTEQLGSVKDELAKTQTSLELANEKREKAKQSVHQLKDQVTRLEEELASVKEQFNHTRGEKSEREEELRIQLQLNAEALRESNDHFAQLKPQHEQFIQELRQQHDAIVSQFEEKVASLTQDNLKLKEQLTEHTESQQIQEQSHQREDALIRELEDKHRTELEHLSQTHNAKVAELESRLATSVTALSDEQTLLSKINDLEEKIKNQELMFETEKEKAAAAQKEMERKYEQIREEEKQKLVEVHRKEEQKIRKEIEEEKQQFQESLKSKERESQKVSKEEKKTLQQNLNKLQSQNQQLIKEKEELTSRSALEISKLQDDHKRELVDLTARLAHSILDLEQFEAGLDAMDIEWTNKWKQRETEDEEFIQTVAEFIEGVKRQQRDSSGGTRVIVKQKKSFIARLFPFLSQD